MQDGDIVIILSQNETFAPNEVGVLALGLMEGGRRLHTISIYYWEIMEWISLKI